MSAREPASNGSKLVLAVLVVAVFQPWRPGALAPVRAEVEESAAEAIGDWLDASTVGARS